MAYQHGQQYSAPHPPQADHQSPPLEGEFSPHQHPQFPPQPQPHSAQYSQTEPMAAQEQPPAQTGEWSNDLMSCGPTSTCCLGYWCPCLLLGRTSNRIETNDASDDPDCVNMDCCVFYALSMCGLYCIWGTVKRKEIREKFGIKGSGFNDCCAAYWCACCALIQQEKEVHGRIVAGQSGAVMQGYQPTPGMEMPLQKQ